MKEAATNALGRLFGAANLGGGATGDLASLRIEAGDLIVGSLNEPDLELRLASMAALGEMRYERAVQSLTDLFNYHKKGPEAMAALDAVAAIGHPGSLPVFLAQLGHRDVQRPAPRHRGHRPHGRRRVDGPGESQDGRGPVARTSATRWRSRRRAPATSAR